MMTTHIDDPMRTHIDDPSMRLWCMTFRPPIAPACNKWSCYCEYPQSCDWPSCEHARTHPRIMYAHKTIYQDIHVVPDGMHPLSGCSEFYRTIPVDMVLEPCVLTICSDCERLLMTTWVPRGMYEVHL